MASIGDIVYLELMGRGILILNSHKRAEDLLDKLSLNYSDRPGSVILDL